MDEKLVLKSKGSEYLPMTAGKIIEALEQHHRNDVFIPQCKSGKSWGSELRIMDAWAMPRSYSHFRTIGYEVKVDRADFENDQKWIEYVDYCHFFFFVCPAGLIRASDLPKGVGLMWVSQTGRLHTKTHATKREPDITKLNNLLTYVVMSRAKIEDNLYNNGNAVTKDHITSLREEVERAEKNGELASFVKGHVKETYDKTKKLQRELERREENMKNFAHRLERLKITWDSTKEDWNNINEVNEKIRLLKQDIDDHTIWELSSLGSRLTEVAKKLQEYKA